MKRNMAFTLTALELSKLIKKGLLTRDEALEKIALQVEKPAIEETLVQLGVKMSEIQALGTKGAAAA